MWWQVLLSNAVTLDNIWPRTSLAETVLLALFCWFLGLLSGVLLTTLVISARCRHLLWVLVCEGLRSAPIFSPEERIAAYRCVVHERWRLGLWIADSCRGQHLSSPIASGHSRERGLLGVGSDSARTCAHS